MARNIPGYPPERVAVNTFSAGMRQDNDFQFQRNQTYRYSISGRIFYNENGDAAWMNEKGNKFFFSLTDSAAHPGVSGYIPVGFCELPSGTLIFSSDGTNSEIGFLKIVSDGKLIGYEPLFNDLYDPNGDKLNLEIGHKIKKAIPSVESVNIERAYWTDGYNEPRVFNRMIGLTSVSPEFTSGDYKPIGGYTIGNKYPWFYSVHSMSQQSDFSMGKIKFVRQLGDYDTKDGALKTGIVRMAYRLVTRDGYSTLWTPLTHYYFITLDGANFSLTNYHTRSMYASNIQTNIGMRFTIENIDTRFYQVEMAYVYSIDKDSTVEANIFYREKMSDYLVSSRIDFRNMSGDAVSFSEFSKTIIPVKTCQTLEQKDNILWEGNITTYGDYVIDTDDIEIAPFTRTMAADDTGGVADIPLTNVDAVTVDTNVSLQSYIDKLGAAVNDNYNVVNDWLNYKGVQWAHLFPSYWRGETYPFCIVIFDLKGNPFYAQHIEDYTFPQQYENNESYALIDNTDPSGTIRMMGAKFSNIKIPKDKLFENGDINGKLLISGFSIMRTKRVKRILCQGIFLNTVCKGKGDSDPASDESFPLPMPSNSFDESHHITKTPDICLYDDNFYPENPYNQYGNRPSYFNFHSPDIYFQRNIWEGTQQDKVMSSDTMKLVEVYSNLYNYLCGSSDCGWSNNCPDSMIELMGLHAHYYTKHYHKLTDSEKIPTQKKGDETRISADTNFHISANSTVRLMFSVCHDDTDLFAQLAPMTWTLKGDDFKTVGVSTNTYHASYFSANYIVRQSDYYTKKDETSFANRLYFSTGHFQPITKSILNTLPVNYEPDGITVKEYVFNGVEVWGGDCYPFLFDFTRLYPVYSVDCETTKHIYPDYANSVVFPLESDMNFALRTGRTFASQGTRSEDQACTGGTEFENGIMLYQPEEFNLNSVLLFEEDINLYTSLQPQINPYIVKFPYRWIYSLTKISGENYDAYRNFLPLNFGDVQGQYGEIVGCGKLFNYIYSIQQTGFGRLRIKDRIAIPVSMGNAIQTGLGKTYDGIDMINTDNGTNFPYSILVSDRAILFADTTSNCMIRFGGNGTNNITTIYNMKDWGLMPLGNFDNDRIVYDYDNPSASVYEHIHGVYDNVREEFRMTLIALNSEHLQDTEQTIVFDNNEKLTGYTSFQPDIVLQYICCNGYIISQPMDEPEQQYIYYEGNRGEWFGDKSDSEITIVVNEGFNTNKVFDNLMMNINEEGAGLLKRVEFISGEGQTQAIDFSTFGKARYRDGFYRFPAREPHNDERLRGHYLIVKFIFSNDGNKIIKFVANKTIFRYYENLQ